jgi:hypothetical protein
MLCGLHKTWKQPVNFYLIHGSTKKKMLFIMEVLDTCHKAGLLVSATMFDMGAYSVKAL